MITQGYPLTARKYEVAGEENGQPVYRAAGEVFAVVGWVGGTENGAVPWSPILVPLTDLAALAFVPEAGDQFEFERGD
jgi:hypothetical protein